MRDAAAVGFRDLEFDQHAFVRIVQADGRTVIKCVPVGMPRLRDHLTKCVFFLFGRDPKCGNRIGPGAAGFFVEYSSQTLQGLWHVYAITTRHSLPAHSDIRINTKAGSTRFLDFDPAEWQFSDNEDLAAVDVTDAIDLNYETFTCSDDISWVREGDFIWENDPTGRGKIGDQTIMLGLFADYSGGGVLNVPVARFGNVAAIPNPKVPVRLYPNDSFVRPAFLNDMRSRSGFSGSPVWAWYTPYSDLDVHTFGGLYLGTPSRKLAQLCLIGLHRGQFREKADILSGPRCGDTVDVASSMTVVIPAWEIKTLLERSYFSQSRVDRDMRPDRISARNAYIAGVRTQES